MVCLVVKQTRDRFRCMQERQLVAAEMQNCQFVFKHAQTSLMRKGSKLSMAEPDDDPDGDDFWPRGVSFLT